MANVSVRMSESDPEAYVFTMEFNPLKDNKLIISSYCFTFPFFLFFLFLILFVFVLCVANVGGGGEF